MTLHDTVDWNGSNVTNCSLRTRCSLLDMLVRESTVLIYLLQMSENMQVLLWLVEVLAG